MSSPSKPKVDSTEFIKEFSTPRSPRAVERGCTSSVCGILRSVTPEMAGALKVALTNSWNAMDNPTGWTIKDVTQSLERFGYRVGYGAVKGYRENGCACTRREAK